MVHTHIVDTLYRTKSRHFRSYKHTHDSDVECFLSTDSPLLFVVVVVVAVVGVADGGFFIVILSLLFLQLNHKFNNSICYGFYQISVGQKPLEYNRASPNKYKMKLCAHIVFTLSLFHTTICQMC